ncbi:MAG: hypothetical protein JWO13_3404 [Acidobacteriales bacterium]|nr:hypothetical protein [Terriglobales bacterium]
MKRFMFSILAFCLMISAAAFAGSDKTATKETSVTGWVTDPMCGAKGEHMDDAECAKRCSARDGKLVLVTDGDNKVWAVVNSEALKGHEGHHVKVSGHPDEDKGTIQVVTVALLDNQKPVAKESMKKHEADKKKVEKKS